MTQRFFLVNKKDLICKFPDCIEIIFIHLFNSRVKSLSVVRQWKNTFFFDDYSYVLLQVFYGRRNEGILFNN